jgi:hypothetical protein
MHPLTLFVLTFFPFAQTMSQSLTPEQIVQRNLDFYNARNIEGFMSSFSNDIALYTYPEPIPATVGLEAVRKVYTELFVLSPNLHSTIIKRIVFDNKIIDHERIVGRRGSSEPIEIVLIYEVKEDKIFRVSAIRK